MTVATLPGVNERLIVTVRSGELRTYQVSALVDSVTGDGHMDLRIHTHLDPARIRAGVPLALDCPRGSEIWRMLSRVEGVRDGSGETPVLTVSPPVDEYRVEGRRFLRLHVWLPVRFVRIDIPPGYEDADVATRSLTHERWAAELARHGRDGRVFSLGAGGFAMVPQGSMHAGNEVFIEFVDQGRLSERLAARTLWCDQRDDEHSGAPAQAGLMFVGLTDAEQDAILDLVIRTRRHRVKH